MAYLSTAGGHPRPSRLATLFADTQDFFSLMGAAVRVSRAVESNRQPNRQDLLTLGITGNIPGNRYTSI